MSSPVAAAAVLSVLLLVAAPSQTRAHGFLSKPRSRNFLATRNNCPHCMNGGGVAQTRTAHYPRSRHGMCGDPASGPRDHEAGGEFFTGHATGYYRQGGHIRLTTSITTDHRGAIEYRVCRYPVGSPDTERRALTEACLNKHVLHRASDGARYMFLGNGPERGYDRPKPFTATYALPKDLVCDGKRWKCVLQMHWVTGNTCSPSFIPKKHRVRTLGVCGTRNLWPEEFWNCADIVVLPKKK